MNDLTPNSYESFLELAAEGTVVPVVRRIMADLLTPVGAYLRIERLSPFSFLLESVEGGEKVARYSFLGVDPHTVVRSRAGRVVIASGSVEKESNEPMLVVLRRLSGRHIPVRTADLPPFVC
ncbi:MAG TPA: anthranilate synthase component I, partial [Blastocatellia bacterium]|nr:anthranilate synthase component I [Blastocatellia bacterium]